MKEIRNMEQQPELQEQKISAEQIRVAETSAASDEINKIGASSWESEIDSRTSDSRPNVAESKSAFSEEEIFDQFSSAGIERINPSQQQNDDSILSLDDIFSQKYNEIVDSLENKKVEYRPIQNFETPMTEQDIINRLGGGDMTKGSCSSLAFAYAGNKAGYDVLDFRDGDSRSFFSSRNSIQMVADIPDINASVLYEKNDIDAANQLLSKMQDGKEYYFATGKHAAIVRCSGSNYQYLELQHPSTGNGWHSLDDNELYKRFGCKDARPCECASFLMEIDSMANSSEFCSILGYINTSESKQKKGDFGDVR